MLLILGSLTAGAIVPYTTYTYSYHGMMQESPAAYVPLKQITTSTLIYSLSADGSASDNAKQKYGANGSELVFADTSLKHLPFLKSIHNRYFTFGTFSSSSFVSSQKICVIGLKFSS